MGMAAGQARLLSITSRMSDNELRAQIINNNKMRLASESSQASENYIAALNEAQYMFTNYDADNNKTFQQLTYNALTAYNPYNSQYALTNASGNVLLSELDAENYKNSSNLTEFLACYGLVQSTSYFDQFENIDFENAIQDDNGNSAGFKGLTLKSSTLYDMYYGGTVEIGELGEVTTSGYIAIDSTPTIHDYQKALANYLDKKDIYFSCVKEAMEHKFEELIENVHFAENKTTSSQPSELKSYKAIVDYLNGVKSDDENAMTYMQKGMYEWISTLANTMSEEKYIGKGAQSSYYEDLKNEIKTYSKNYLPTEYTSDPLIYVTDGTDLFIATKGYTKVDGEYKETISSIICCVRSDNQIDFYNSDDGIFGNESTNVGYTYNLGGSGDKAGFSGTNIMPDTDDLQSDTNGTTITLRSKSNEVAEDTRTFYKVTDKSGKTIDVPTFTVYTQNDFDTMKDHALSFLQSLKESIYTQWSADTNASWITEGIPATYQDTLNSAKTDYEEAAKALAKVIFGNEEIEGKEGILDDLPKLYNQCKDGDQFAEDFKPVFSNLLLDIVMNTLGEPKTAWIDITNSNENADAKARWYENLYNRIQSGGYKVLQDGLASSPEWIQFAFESGIVNMEQVDSYITWKPLIYSNCSDITTQTNDQMVAKAEAEYKAAMNKIENKDKRYDLELKNIDTEHNSLQTEYESIKTAIDKNVERTFKLYS